MDLSGGCGRGRRVGFPCFPAFCVSTLQNRRAPAACRQSSRAPVDTRGAVGPGARPLGGRRAPNYRPEGEINGGVWIGDRDLCLHGLSPTSKVFQL